MANKAAIHSASSFTDREEISLLEYILSKHKLVASDLKKGDTWPNIDGYLELVNLGGEPEGKLEVQVKTLGKRRINKKVSYHFDDNNKFFSYCEKTKALPILFVGMDLENERGFWVEMTPEIIKEAKKRTIYLPKENIIAENSKDYGKLWKDIYDKRCKAIEESNNAQKSLIRQLVITQPNSQLLKKNEVVINNILDNIKNKILIYEGLLFFISPAFINDSKMREGLRKFIKITPQQEELFIDELTQQKILSRTGDVITFDDESLGKEKLSYLIASGIINVDKTYKSFKEKKIREFMLNKMVDIPERKEINDFLSLLAKDLYQSVGKFKTNDVTDINLELLEKYTYRVSSLTLKIVEKIINFKVRLPQKTYKSPFGNIKGKSYDDLILRCINLLKEIRYLESKKVFATLLSLSRSPVPQIKRKALEGIKDLSEYNLFSLKRIGYMPQELVLNALEELDVNNLVKNYEVVLEVGRELVTPSFEGQEMSDYKTFTLSFGPLKASDKLKEIRGKTIVVLQNLYNYALDLSVKNKTLKVLNEASRTPSQGIYSDELTAIVLADTNNLIDFYITILLQADGEIVKEVEEQSHWFIKRFTKEKLSKIKELEQAITNNPEYQIFKVFFGHDYDYDEDLDWRISREKREKKVQEFVDNINKENLIVWKKRISDTIKNFSDENADKYQFFNVFLRKLGQQKPQIAHQVLIDLEKELQPFLVHLLAGIWESQENKLVKQLVGDWIKQNKNLMVCATFFFYLDQTDKDIIKKIYKKAVEVKDFNVISTLLRLIVSIFDGDKELKDTFIDGIEQLTSQQNTKWTFFPLRNIKQLMESFSSNEIDIVLDNLVYVQSIDYDEEEILSPLAEKYPERVIKFFHKRVAQRIKEGRESKYDAVPYNLHELKDVLSNNPEETVSEILTWFTEKDWLYRWEGSHLIQEIFSSFNDQLEKALLEMIKSGDKNKAEAVLVIFRAYKGEPFLHRTCKEFVKKYLRNPGAKHYKDYRSELFIILSATGVVSGEYGMRDAYIQKKQEIQSWKTDKSKTIQLFVKGYEEGLDKQIAYEQKRADEDIELMKKGAM